MIRFRRKQLQGDLRTIIRLEDSLGRSGLDSTMVANRVLRESLEALESLEDRLDAVHETLNERGAPILDEQGAELNANGRLVDWIAGRRVDGWIGAEPGELERLRVLRATADVFWRELGHVHRRGGEYRYPEVEAFDRALRASGEVRDAG